MHLKRRGLFNDNNPEIIEEMYLIVSINESARHFNLAYKLEICCSTSFNNCLFLNHWIDSNRASKWKIRFYTVTVKYNYTNTKSSLTTPKFFVIKWKKSIFLSFLFDFLVFIFLCSVVLWLDVFYLVVILCKRLVDSVCICKQENGSVGLSVKKF